MTTLRQPLRHAIVSLALLLTVVSSAASDEEWSYYGPALMTDGWFQPLCGSDGLSGYEVMAEQHVSRPGLFRLTNPFTCDGAVAIRHIRADGMPHHMIIDVTDPKCVVIDLMDTGIIYDGEHIMAGNYAGFYHCAYGFDTQTFSRYAKSSLGSSYIDTYSDGIVRINLPFHTTESTSDAFYYWPETSAIAATINLDHATGVNRPEADTSHDNNVKYYNLQGVRLTAPATGQLIIAVSQSGVSKIIYK